MYGIRITFKSTVTAPQRCPCSLEDRTEFRSYRILDGEVTEEPVTVVE